MIVAMSSRPRRGPALVEVGVGDVGAGAPARRAPPASICQTSRSAGQRRPRTSADASRRGPASRRSPPPRRSRPGSTDLLGGGGLVDRHRHRAGGPDGEVDEGPLVAGPAHQGDPVAGVDAGGDQALGQRDDLGAELRRRSRRSTRALPPGEGDMPGRSRPCAPARRRGCPGWPPVGRAAGLLVHGRLLGRTCSATRTLPSATGPR